MKIDIYSQDGKKTGDIEVSEKIFGVKGNDTLIHRALLLQLSNARNPVAHAKQKGEVRGGGKKPYAQKHTGRARQGSIRNPHFRGGGVVFPPRSLRNFTLKMPLKERRKALFTALSRKLQENQIKALDSYRTEKPKTKLFAEMLKKLKFPRNVLVVLPQKNELIRISSRNLRSVKTLLVNYLNVRDLLKYQDILFLKDALPKLEEIFLKK